MASVSASVGIITHTVIRAAIPPSLSLLIQGSLVITHIWRKKIDFSFNQNLFWFFSLFSMKFMHFITLTSMRSSQDLQPGRLPVLPNHAKRHLCRKSDCEYCTQGQLFLYLLLTVGGWPLPVILPWTPAVTLLHCGAWQQLGSLGSATITQELGTLSYFGHLL